MNTVNWPRIIYGTLGLAAAVCARKWLPDVPEVAMLGSVLIGLAIKGEFLPAVAVADAKQEAVKDAKRRASMFPPAMIVLLALGSLGCAGTQAPTLPTMLSPDQVTRDVAAANDAINLATATTNTANSLATVVCPTATGAMAVACDAIKVAHAGMIEAISFGTRAVDAYAALGAVGLVTQRASNELGVAVSNAITAARALAWRAEEVTRARMDPDASGPAAPPPATPAAEVAPAGP